MKRRPPRYTLTDTPGPDTTLFRAMPAAIPATADRVLARRRPISPERHRHRRGDNCPTAPTIDLSPGRWSAPRPAIDRGPRCRGTSAADCAADADSSQGAISASLSPRSFAPPGDTTRPGRAGYTGPASGPARDARTQETTLAGAATAAAWSRQTPSAVPVPR